ncbi:ComEC/Rec2 family competence protein [Maricaulis sp.]|uniref:ComEC/Rec2 family competence protein n=1 Tax=Maricaulis sp. TaxID=1486257 RepID=UPI002B276271|nr:ComEC/Rec2 family competence protein [Maricaulis sp.]
MRPAKSIDPFADFGPVILTALGGIIGCSAYFFVSAEPGPVVFLVPAVTGLVLGLLVHFSPVGRKRWLRLTAMLAILLVAAAAFMWRAQDHTRAHHGATVYRGGGEAVLVEGWLEAVDRSGSGRQRLLIRVSNGALAASSSGVVRVRVLGDPAGLVAGDAVALRAVLSPPRPAAVPGSYDFAFHAGFSNIVATGYGISPATAGPSVDGDRLARGIARIRASLSSHIRDRMAPRPGGLAAALLTGDRAHIAPRDVEALRRAGLGHVLAISGMHMALLAGGVFFAVRLCLSAITPWARRHDPALPAAFVALIFAAGYLVLSGSTIPTQRAFIMTVSVLGAVILRRRALSMHTLALAVIAVLVMQPQAIVTPGFQMSFSAAAALVAVARVWQQSRGHGASRGVFGQLRLFIGGLGTTSLVAGTATAGFAAFHFHRIATFGLAGNLLVMPIFSLLVMPAGVLGLVLIPVGLDALPFRVMEAGLVVMLDLAGRVADWPGAQRTVVAAPGAVLALFSAGFILLLLLRGAFRGAGGAVMAIALAAWMLLPQPDLFISETGLVLARNGDEAWVVSDRRRSRFAARVFLEARGVGGAPPQRWQARCDGSGCSARLGELTVTRLTRLDDWATDCARSDIIVSDARMPTWIIAQCRAEVFDPDRLARTGSQVIQTGGHRIMSVRSARPAGVRRLWSTG